MKYILFCILIIWTMYTILGTIIGAFGSYFVMNIDMFINSSKKDNDADFVYNWAYLGGFIGLGYDSFLLLKKIKYTLA